MSEVIYEPRPRYVVETGVSRTQTFSQGGMLAFETMTEWRFELAFFDRKQAEEAAISLANGYEFVRVIDRGEE